VFTRQQVESGKATCPFCGAAVSPKRIVYDPPVKPGGSAGVTAVCTRCQEPFEIELRG
jgi:transcription elongation factor Elf1